jgi:hypothetical protein
LGTCSDAEAYGRGVKKWKLDAADLTRKASPRCQRDPDDLDIPFYPAAPTFASFQFPSEGHLLRDHIQCAALAAANSGRPHLAFDAERHDRSRER